MDPRHAGGITSLNWLSVQREELEEVTGEKEVSHLINSRNWMDGLKYTKELVSSSRTICMCSSVMVCVFSGIT